MKSLRKLFRLSRSEAMVLVEAAFLLTAVRLALWLGGLQRTRRLLRRAEPRCIRLPDLTVKQIAGMVTCAARRCPLGSTCLTRALAAHVLLARSDYPSRLCIGVARSENGRIDAHAWLERNQQVILGGTEEDVNRYMAFDRVDELTI